MSSEAPVREETVEEENWRQIREKVLERDGYACRFCGTTNEEHLEETDRGLDAHHIIPRSDGGRDTMRNLVALCRSCHRTMESLHGQAMGEIASNEDYADDLAGINKVFRIHHDVLDDVDDEMAEFIDGHPIFADKFNVYEDDTGVQAPGLQSSAEAVSPPIESEWEFAVTYGYKQGILTVISAIDGRTNVPFEGVDVDE